MDTYAQTSDTQGTSGALWAHVSGAGAAALTPGHTSFSTRGSMRGGTYTPRGMPAGVDSASGATARLFAGTGTRGEQRDTIDSYDHGGGVVDSAATGVSVMSRHRVVPTTSRHVQPPAKTHEQGAAHSHQPEKWASSVNTRTTDTITHATPRIEDSVRQSVPRSAASLVSVYTAYELMHVRTHDGDPEARTIPLGVRLVSSKAIISAIVVEGGPTTPTEPAHPQTPEDGAEPDTRTHADEGERADPHRDDQSEMSFAVGGMSVQGGAAHPPQGELSAEKHSRVVQVRPMPPYTTRVALGLLWSDTPNQEIQGETRVFPVCKESRHRQMVLSWCRSADVTPAKLDMAMKTILDDQPVHMIALVLDVHNISAAWVRISFLEDTIDYLGKMTSPPPPALMKGILVPPGETTHICVSSMDCMEMNALTELRLRWNGELTPDNVERCFLKRAEGNIQKPSTATTFVGELGHNLLVDMLSYITRVWESRNPTSNDTAELHKFAKSMNQQIKESKETDGFIASALCASRTNPSNPLLDTIIEEYRAETVSQALLARVRSRPSALLVDVSNASGDTKTHVAENSVLFDGYAVCMPECNESIELCRMLSRALE